jgi:hypothetical protein
MLCRNQEDRHAEHDIQEYYTPVLGDNTATAPVELPSRGNPSRATLYEVLGMQGSKEAEYRDGQNADGLARLSGREKSSSRNTNYRRTTMPASPVAPNRQPTRENTHIS